MGDVDKMREDQNMKMETDYEETQKIDTSKIEILTDDCLIAIFQHLTTITDKIRIERVCKRWKNVSQRSWNNFKSLDFSTETWGIKENLPGQSLIRKIDFDKIIRLSGKYLTSISIDVGTFVKICNLLPKILKLQLIDDCLDKNKRCLTKYSNIYGNSQKVETTSQCTTEAWQLIISWLISHGENLTNFEMVIEHSHYKEEDFVRVLEKMKQLKSLYLYGNNYLDWTGAILLELPFEIIEEMILKGCLMEFFDNNLLFTIIKKCKKLKTFSIEGSDESAFGILEALSSQLKNLELSLVADLSNQSVILSKMSALAVLIHLEKLDVSYCFFVGDAFLEVLAKNCKKLTYLNLRHCDRVTDRGISSICSLEKLTYLSIRHLLNVRNAPLQKLTSLVVLDACDSNIREKCLCSFLKRAHQLRALDVAYCPSITNKLLNVAIEVAKIHNTNNALDFYVYDTQINMNVLDEKPPLLNIFNSCLIALDKYGITDPFFPIKYPKIHIN